eukprot:Rhum_TRINITY_DN13777_c1_g1::Rhum_TRINITY_DN13777_c1_g1_i1::g.64188::m.64188
MVSQTTTTAIQRQRQHRHYPERVKAGNARQVCSAGTIQPQRIPLPALGADPVASPLLLPSTHRRRRRRRRRRHTGLEAQPEADGAHVAPHGRCQHHAAQVGRHRCRPPREAQRAAPRLRVRPQVRPLLRAEGCPRARGGQGGRWRGGRGQGRRRRLRAVAVPGRREGAARRPLAHRPVEGGAGGGVRRAGEAEEGGEVGEEGEVRQHVAEQLAGEAVEAWWRRRRRRRRRQPRRENAGMLRRRRSRRGRKGCASFSVRCCCCDRRRLPLLLLLPLCSRSGQGERVGCRGGGSGGRSRGRCCQRPLVPDLRLFVLTLSLGAKSGYHLLMWAGGGGGGGGEGVREVRPTNRN